MSSLPMEENTGGVNSGWLPLSAEQVRQQRFRETSLARRGYRADEVESYLSRVAADIDRWSSAYAEAAGEIRRLRNYFREHGESGASRAREVSVEAVSVLSRAQAHADQLIADAQAHARTMQQDARSHAEALMGQAREEADRAAREYRARSGPGYNADREQTERLAALGRSILGALGGATTQLDGATAQMRAIAEAFSAELATFTDQGAHQGPHQGPQQGGGGQQGGNRGVTQPVTPPARPAW